MEDLRALQILEDLRLQDLRVQTLRVEDLRALQTLQSSKLKLGKDEAREPIVRAFLEFF